MFSLSEQTVASIVNCVAGIAGSIMLGKYLDKTKSFKMLQIVIAIAISLSILSTFLMLHFDAPNALVVFMCILSGAPISSVSVISY